MGCSKNIIVLAASAFTAGVLFIAYTLDLDKDYEAAGDMAFVAIPSIMIVMGTFWATSEIYSSNSSNTMKMRGVSVLLTILLGAYLAYLIIEYKDSAKNPIIIPGHGTRSVSNIDEFSFFMDHKVNFRDEADASYTAQQETDILAGCATHFANPSKTSLFTCSLFRIDTTDVGCKIGDDGKTVSGCFTTLNNEKLTAEFTVNAPVFEKYTSGNIKTVHQQVNVKFLNSRFKSLITPANCFDVKYSADPECTFGFTLPWRFQDTAGFTTTLDYKPNNYKRAPTSVQIVINNANAADSSAVASTNFDLYFVNTKKGIKKAIFYLTDWLASIDLKKKETLTWKPRTFYEKEERDTSDIRWEIFLSFLTKKSDLTLPVEIREESVRLPFFTIFTALMAFLTPLGAIFGFFYPNMFPKRYAAFGDRPVFFDQLDKDAGGVDQHE